jgi:hypothetical protein
VVGVAEMILRSRGKGATVGGSWDSWGLYIMDDGSECVRVGEVLTLDLMRFRDALTCRSDANQVPQFMCVHRMRETQ